jgi:hypothetical protein
VEARYSELITSNKQTSKQTNKQTNKQTSNTSLNKCKQRLRRVESKR